MTTNIPPNQRVFDLITEFCKSCVAFANSRSGEKLKFCLVPRPLSVFHLRQSQFRVTWFEGKSSPRIRHPKKLTVRAWEKRNYNSYRPD